MRRFFWVNQCTHNSSAISLVTKDPPQSPSIPLKKGEEENLVDFPPFTRGAGGIFSLKRRQVDLRGA
jgi:hypothetical protein